LIGCVVLALIAFRLGWGVLGSPRSRFADFLRPWAVVRSYVVELVRLSPPRHAGHNPLGGWMVALLLAACFATAATGLFSGGDGGAGPFAASVFGSGSEGLAGLHAVLGNFLVPLVVVHVLGVLADWLLTGDNVIRAMITGAKELDRAQAAREPPLVGHRRAIALGVVVAVLGGYLLARFPPDPDGHDAEAESGTEAG
jgi:cytochrome b